MRESMVDGASAVGVTSAPAPARRIDHHSFTGTPREVAMGLYALPSSLVRHTFYALLLQGDGQAEVRIFERTEPGDGDGRVAVWEGVTLDGLRDELAALVAGLASAAPDPGDDPPADPVAAVAELLRGKGPFTDLGVVPAPPTARGAFGHPMRRYAHDQVVQAVVVAGDRSG